MFTSIVVPTLANWDRVNRLHASIREHTKDCDYEIIVIDNGNKPLGFTDPANRGLAAARGDLLIVLNDDVTVTPGWLPPLIQAALEGAWVFTPSTDDPRDAERVVLPWAHCFSREAYETLNGFDPQFVFWCSDDDLQVRCSVMGKPMFKVKDSKVNHEGSTTQAKPEFSILKTWGEEDVKRFHAKWPPGSYV